MEPSKKKKLAVGVFIGSGLILFIVVIFVIGSKENMFTSTFKLQAAFEKVNGLKTGATVRLNGINVGTVDEIEIYTDRSVVVRMTIEKKVQEFIKKDSKASVSSEGLVGNKIVEITAGSSDSPGATGGDVLHTIPAVETEDIMRSLKQTSENASDLTRDLATIVQKVNSGEGTIGQLINNKDIYNNVDTTMRNFAGYSGQLKEVFQKITFIVDNVSGDITDLSKEVKSVTTDIAEVTRKMNSGESVAGTLLADTVFANNLKDIMRNAKYTSKNLEDGSFSFSQNMEALKHNFLFKGYFEDIGYWDKTDWENNIDKREMNVRLREQELLKKEKELKELQDKLNNSKN
jgi:phospholipid/cholesterol/gamma-HCH transport system substrate-binding protein